MGKFLGEVVITGGPRSGKTCAKHYIEQACLDAGIRVLYIPEVASLVIGAGNFDIGEISKSNKVLHQAIEVGMYYVQEGMRKYVDRAASLYAEDVLVVYDRAEIDIAAYMGVQELTTFLATETKTTYSTLRDSYDLVIYLETTAKAMPEQYSNYNNPARYETASEAIYYDGRTHAAWSGHRNLKEIFCKPTFEEKMDELLVCIRQFIQERRTRCVQP